MTTGPARALLRRLGQYLDGFSGCFSRQPQREAASQYLDGLLNDSERKSMQAMHGRLSDSGQYQALQHFITYSPWDAARVWAHLRTVVPARGHSRHRRHRVPQAGDALGGRASGNTAGLSARSAIARCRAR